MNRTLLMAQSVLAVAAYYRVYHRAHANRMKPLESLEFKAFEQERSIEHIVSINPTAKLFGPIGL